VAPSAKESEQNSRRNSFNGDDNNNSEPQPLTSITEEDDSYTRNHSDAKVSYLYEVDEKNRPEVVPGEGHHSPRDMATSMGESFWRRFKESQQLQQQQDQQQLDQEREEAVMSNNKKLQVLLPPSSYDNNSSNKDSNSSAKTPVIQKHNSFGRNNNNNNVYKKEAKSDDLMSMEGLEIVGLKHNNNNNNNKRLNTGYNVVQIILRSCFSSFLRMK